MFFTQEDYRKIEKWLLSNSIKDTEFVEASAPLQGNETLAFVQKGKNVKVSLKDLIDQIFLLGVSDFLNITDKYDAPNISLEEAIRLIPSRARKEGQVITFLDMEDHWHIYQFKGVLNQWNVLDTWEDLFDWEKLIIDSILPDEEDLTKSLPDENGNSYLSLKDREYNPNDFSGLGRVILRKNIVEIDDPIYGKVKKNVLYPDMISNPNTIYEIRYDFDLNGAEITIHEGCVLKFNGGSLNNGSLKGVGTEIKSEKYKIFSNIIFKGVFCNTFYFDWVYEDNIDISNRFNCENFNLQLSSKTYNIRVSEYDLPSGMIINGVTREVSYLNITPIKEDGYVFRLLPFSGLSNVSIQLMTDYKGTLIIAADNRYCLYRQGKPGPSKYDSLISKVKLIGKWVKGDIYSEELTAIKFILVDYDDDGNKIELGSKGFDTALAYLYYNDIQIQYFYNAILMFAERKFDKQGDDGLWSNDITFSNIEIWANYGFRTITDHILHPEQDNKARYGDVRIDNYCFQRLSSYPMEPFYGYVSNWSLNSYVLWDTACSGHIGGNIIVGTCNRTIYNPYQKDYGFVKLDNFDLEVRSAIDKQADKIIFNLGRGTKESLKQLVFKPGSFGGILTKIIPDKEDLECDFDIFTPLPIFADGRRTVLRCVQNGKSIEKYSIVYPFKIGNTNSSILGKTPYINVAGDDGVYDRIKRISPFIVPLDDNSYNLYAPGVTIGKSGGELYIIGGSATSTLRISDSTYIIGPTKGTSEERNNLTGWGIGIRYYDTDLNRILYGSAYLGQAIKWRTADGVPLDKTEIDDSTYIDDSIPDNSIIFIKRYNKPAFIRKGQPYDFNGRSVSYNWVQGIDELPEIKKGEGVSLLYNSSNEEVYISSAHLWWKVEKTHINVSKNGTFANKPSSSLGIGIGFAYFCTDRQTAEGATNGIMIYYKGDDVWVDALGRVVS